MSHRSSRSTVRLVARMRARRNAREFERALLSASPSMQSELRAMAARQDYRGL